MTECSKGVFHQSDGIAKGTEITFLRWHCQLVEGYKENCETEAWENGWERGLAWGKERLEKKEGEENLVGLVISLTWCALLYRSWHSF